MSVHLTHPDPEVKAQLESKMNKLERAREHIQNHPWGVRPIYEVFHKGAASWRDRTHYGYFFDESFASMEARLKNCSVTKSWAVRVGTLWFKIASVYPIKVSAEAIKGAQDAYDPTKERSVYERVEVKSRWRPLTDCNNFYIVDAVLTAKFDTNKANRVQVIYYDERYPDTKFCHPMTRWHTSFVEVKPIPEKPSVTDAALSN